MDHAGSLDPLCTSQSLAGVLHSLETKKSLQASKKTKTKREIFLSPSFYKNLTHFFGTKFIIFITNNYFFLKGMSKSLVRESALPLNTLLRYDNQSLQTISIFSQIPWSTKGLFGVASDNFPLFGYHKTSYIVILPTVSTIFGILLLTLPLKALSVYVIGVCFLMLEMSTAALDLLCEGKYTRIMTENPTTKGDICSYIWFVQYLANLTVGTFIGSITEYYGPYPVLALATVCIGQVVIFALLGFFEEKRVAPHLRNKINWYQLQMSMPFVIISVALTAGNMLTTFLITNTSTTFGLIYQWTMAFVIGWGCFLFLPRVVAKCNLYLLFTGITFPSLGGALSNFYTAADSCVPNGPHFSMQYFQTVNVLASSIAGLVGIVCFQTFFGSMSFRKFFAISTFILCIGCLNDFIIVKRWYVDYLGISDKVTYLIGDGIVQNLVSMLVFMPSIILLSRICPKNIESTAYAMLASFSNFANVVSGSTGKFLQEKFNISIIAEGSSCSYDNLAMLVLICAFIIPCVTLPVGVYLLPKCKQDDPISVEELRDNKSWYQKCAEKKGWPVFDFDFSTPCESAPYSTDSIELKSLEESKSKPIP